MYIWFRGCLFYGPPGTGKTLMARALANECSIEGKKVAFFMRKGADCLSKWVGESERQLRLLFDQVNYTLTKYIYILIVMIFYCTGISNEACNHILWWDRWSCPCAFLKARSNPFLNCFNPISSHGWSGQQGRNNSDWYVNAVLFFNFATIELFLS